VGNNLSELLALVVIGVIAAYMFSNTNASKTTSVFDGLAALWAKITNGLLGK